MKKEKEAIYICTIALVGIILFTIGYFYGITQGKEFVTDDEYYESILNSILPENKSEFTHIIIDGGDYYVYHNVLAQDYLSFLNTTNATMLPEWSFAKYDDKFLFHRPGGWILLGNIDEM